MESKAISASNLKSLKLSLAIAEVEVRQSFSIFYPFLFVSYLNELEQIYSLVTLLQLTTILSVNAFADNKCIFLFSYFLPSMTLISFLPSTSIFFSQKSNQLFPRNPMSGWPQTQLYWLSNVKGKYKTNQIWTLIYRGFPKTSPKISIWGP